MPHGVGEKQHSGEQCCMRKAKGKGEEVNVEQAKICEEDEREKSNRRRRSQTDTTKTTNN